MTEGASEHADAPPPGVRSTRRRGRISAAKTATLRDLGPAWIIPPTGPWTPESLVQSFGRDAPLLVDIGVGNGEASVAWSLARPDANLLAIEVHRPGIVALLRALHALPSLSVRVTEADAVAVLGGLEPGTVEAIRVLFPDPWPKRRHVARRLVDRAFVVRVFEVLQPGGTLHLATDLEDYAGHMRSMVATEPGLELRPDTEAVERPVTTYERRGMAAGRAITDLVYRKGNPSPR